jgi:hypothetical protein
VNSTGGAITVEVPTGASAGDTFKIADSRGTAGINNITVDFTTNGYNLFGTANDYMMNVNNTVNTFVFVDATVGWIVEK